MKQISSGFHVLKNRLRGKSEFKRVGWFSCKTLNCVCLYLNYSLTLCSVFMFEDLFAQMACSQITFIYETHLSYCSALGSWYYRS